MVGPIVGQLIARLLARHALCDPLFASAKFDPVLPRAVQSQGRICDLLKPLLADHEIRPGQEFATLTNIIHEEWSGLTVQEHKERKRLKSHNLRDHMTEAELIFTALAELSTRQIAESISANGMASNARAAKAGGNIARGARRELEDKTGKPVVSEENYLPPPRPTKRLKS
jgi:hypothetical protein